MNTGLAAVLLTGLAAVAASHAAPPAEPVRNPQLKVQWASADVRPAAFDKLMLAPAEFEFRPVRPLVGPAGARTSRTEFPATDRAREALAEDTNRIFREELARSRYFTLVDRAGPGVLVVKPALRDIVSRVPPEEPPGRSAVLLDSAGEATLVVSFVDGASGRLLGTASDRRSAEGSSGVSDFGAIRANTVGVTQEVRRVVRRWGVSLDKRVEQLYFAARPR